MTRSTYLALIAVLLSPMAAYADIIEATIDEANDGFTDTVTGITYWDIDKFYDLRSAEVEALGFELDSYSNALALFQNVIDAYPEAGTRNAVFDIMGSIHGYIWMRWDDGVDSDRDDGGYIYDDTTSASANIFNNLYTYSDARFGALVQADARSVPEPGTLALFGIGLLGMGAARRRKKA